MAAAKGGNGTPNEDPNQEKQKSTEYCQVYLQFIFGKLIIHSSKEKIK